MEMIWHSMLYLQKSSSWNYTHNHIGQSTGFWSKAIQSEAEFTDNNLHGWFRDRGVPYTEQHAGKCSTEFTDERTERFTCISQWLDHLVNIHTHNCTTTGNVEGNEEQY